MTYLLSKLIVFKIYQFSACSLQVIAKSDIQLGIPPIPIPLTPKVNQNNSSTLHPQNDCAHLMVSTSHLTRRSHLLNLTRQGAVAISFE